MSYNRKGAAEQLTTDTNTQNLIETKDKAHAQEQVVVQEKLHEARSETKALEVQLNQARIDLEKTREQQETAAAAAAHFSAEASTAREQATKDADALEAAVTRADKAERAAAKSLASTAALQEDLAATRPELTEAKERETVLMAERNQLEARAGRQDTALRKAVELLTNQIAA